MKAHRCSGSVKVSQILINVKRLVVEDEVVVDELGVLFLFPKIVWFPLDRKIPPDTFGSGAVGELLALADVSGVDVIFDSLVAGDGALGVTSFDTAGVGEEDKGREETGFMKSSELADVWETIVGFGFKDDGPASGSTIVIGTRLLKGWGGGLGAEACVNWDLRAAF